METIENYDAMNEYHLIGKSDKECEQIVAMTNLFDQYNTDNTGFMGIEDAYKFMEKTENYQVRNGGELACFDLFQKWDLD